jgi:L-lactate dehydrogenase (cytochrome)
MSVPQRAFWETRSMCRYLSVQRVLHAWWVVIPILMIRVKVLTPSSQINPDAEKALARAAKSTGIIEILSTSASHPVEQIVKQAPGYPFFFQLYVNKDRKKSEEVIGKANQLGFKAIFVTVDAAGRGKRESDERLVVDEVVINPVTGQRAETDKKGGGLTRTMGTYIDQALTWQDLKWIRSLTDLPIVLKGITGAADAKLAMEHNVDGILLSNHGGRNLDYSPPAILILLEMHKACPEIFDRMEVYVDGGIRRGGDIIKALCLGAKAVGIGRTFLYSLTYGTEGAEHLVDILKDEMESVMKLLGIKDLSEVHPGLVNTSDVDHLVPSLPDHPYAKWRPKTRL